MWASCHLVADVAQRHVKTLLKMLGKEYYASETAIEDAVTREASLT